MAINMKKFTRMTPSQVAKCRRNMMGLHRSLLLAHVIGLGGVCLFAIGLMIYHHLTK